MENQKILIVDDEEYIRDLLDTGLEFVGYQTRLAATGQEAIDAVMEEEPDLILLDITMHEVDGLDVIEYLHHRGFDTPVILLLHVIVHMMSPRGSI